VSGLLFLVVDTVMIFAILCVMGVFLWGGELLPWDQYQVCGSLHSRKHSENLFIFQVEIKASFCSTGWEWAVGKQGKGFWEITFGLPLF
jgi:hypothetical protein